MFAIDCLIAASCVIAFHCFSAGYKQKYGTGKNKMWEDKSESEFKKQFVERHNLSRIQKSDWLYKDTRLNWNSEIRQKESYWKAPGPRGRYIFVQLTCQSLMTVNPSKRFGAWKTHFESAEGVFHLLKQYHSEIDLSIWEIDSEAWMVSREASLQKRYLLSEQDVLSSLDSFVLWQEELHLSFDSFVIWKLTAMSSKYLNHCSDSTEKESTRCCDEC